MSSPSLTPERDASLRPPPPHAVRAPSDESIVVDVKRVLFREELERARFFFRIVFAIPLITAAFIPWLSGEKWLRLATALCCAAAAAVAVAMLYIIQKPERYTARLTGICGVFLGLLATEVLYYIGPFSAGVMVLCLLVYFFGTSQHRTVAWVVYMTFSLCYLALAAAVASGTVVDRAIFPTTNTTAFTQWFQLIMSEVVLGLTFYVARGNRRSTERAVDRVNNANLQIQQREALLHEARADLARATRASQGRHTGKKVGAFEVGELLGRGAMGEVYRGTDKVGLPVAIKMLHANLLERPSKIKRFMREAEAAAAVRSPHVPCVYASGFDGDNPYLAMELLDGHDLSWHLRKTGTLSLDLVVEMCLHVSKALAHVREAGVVHRDLKPANVFLVDSLPRTWKVLDFGLSKILWASGSLTRDQAVGTPAYMAPEQVYAGEIDHLADLYALAAMAYRSLTGIPPFSGSQVAHVLYRVAYQQPACPSDFVRLPVDVELALAIGLAKKSINRFENVEAFAAALHVAAKGELDNAAREHGWALLKAHPWGTSLKPKKSHAGAAA